MVFINLHRPQFHGINQTDITLIYDRYQLATPTKSLQQCIAVLIALLLIEK
jgi:hypothetical protein